MSLKTLCLTLKAAGV